jgi:tripartite-type tricarboxylate transporter receptor subunit TctC
MKAVAAAVFLHRRRQHAAYCVRTVRADGGHRCGLHSVQASGPAITDLVGGQVQMMMTGVLALLPHVKSGKLRALAITSPKRSAALPELRSVAESGVPGFDVQVWFGVFMPAGAPRTIVNAVNERIKKMLEGTELRKRLVDQGADPAGSTPEEFGTLVKFDLARWKKVVIATGVASADR